MFDSYGDFGVNSICNIITYYDIRVFDRSCAFMMVFAGIMWLAPEITICVNQIFIS